MSYTTIDEYIAQYPADIRERLSALRTAIRDAAPDADEKISWAMPTFYLNGNLVLFAAFRHHIGFYPGAEGIELFRNRLEENGLSYSKGAAQLPADRPLPLDVVSEIVRFRAAQNRGRKPKKENKPSPAEAG